MRRQSGDTLVEVLMALVILGIVIVSAIAITSRGLAAGQVALEHSQVRQVINSQVRMLQILRDQYVQSATSPNGAEWAAIVAATNETPVIYDSSCTVTGGKGASSFYLQNTGAQITHTLFNPALKPATIAVAGQGMWIEPVRSHEDPVAPANSIRPAYMDFVVRACWQGSGDVGQQQTVTAVRLYDPSRP